MAVDDCNSKPEKRLNLHGVIDQQNRHRQPSGKRYRTVLIISESRKSLTTGDNLIIVASILGQPPKQGCRCSTEHQHPCWQNDQDISTGYHHPTNIGASSRRHPAERKFQTSKSIRFGGTSSLSAGYRRLSRGTKHKLLIAIRWEKICNG